MTRQPIQRADPGNDDDPKPELRIDPLFGPSGLASVLAFLRIAASAMSILMMGIVASLLRVVGWAGLIALIGMLAIGSLTLLAFACLSLLIWLLSAYPPHGALRAAFICGFWGIAFAAFLVFVFHVGNKLQGRSGFPDGVIRRATMAAAIFGTVAESAGEAARRRRREQDEVQERLQEQQDAERARRQWRKQW